MHLTTAKPLILAAEGLVSEAKGQIRFWFCPDWNGDDGQKHRIFEAHSAGGNVFFVEKEAAPYQGLVFYITEPDQPGHGVWVSGQSLRAGEWVHIGVAWDLQAPEGAASRMALYINGKLADSSPSNPSQFQPRGGFTELRFGGGEEGSADCVIDSLQFVAEVPPALPHTIDTTPDRPLHRAALEACRFEAGDEVAFSAVRDGEEETIHVKIGAAAGERDQYGGWRGLRGKRTGSFHCEEHKGRWWIITPEGNAYYALGTDHCRFDGHWCEDLGYAPYGRHNLEKYGSEEPWIEQTLSRLRDWHFNLLSAGHSESLQHRGLPHTVFVAFGTSFSSIDDIVPQVHWTGFPNVFAPQWPEHCDQMAAAQCAPNVGDSWLMGYFLDNELEWYGKSGTEAGIFLEAMKKPAEHTAKQALLELLQQHHETIESFNDVWGTRFRSWGELARWQEPLRVPPGPEAERDWRGYLRLVADRYFAVTTQAIRKHDPEHMIIGCRFAGSAPGIWDICGQYCDVVTFNYYGRVDLDTGDAFGLPELLSEWHQQAAKPMMITEWSFPALDSGLPCTAGAGMRVDTQEQRARCFDIYQRLFFRLPFMVGSDFFMWVDEPALGISETFPEDSNYGLVNEQDEPYPELTAAARSLQGQVYAIHSGQSAELSVEAQVKGAELQIRLRSAGQLDVQPEVLLVADGQESLLADVPPVTAGKSVTVAQQLAELRPPGGHLVTVIVDPDGELPDNVRADNTATVLSFTGRAPESADAVILAANTGHTELRELPVVVPLGECASAGRLQEVSQATVHVTTAAGEPLPFQVDKFSPGPALAPDDELAMLVDLPPGRCVALVVDLDGPLRETRDERPFKFVADEHSFDADNGALRAAKLSDSGAILDLVELRGTLLGNLVPLMWQEIQGETRWPAPDRLEAIKSRVGIVRAVADVQVALSGTAGEQPAPVTAGATYRCAYRIAIYRDVPWLTSRLLWVESTDEQPWRLRAYFHFAQSQIGGTRDRDEPGVKVPNYYLNLGAWIDEQEGLLYGVLPPRQPDCAAHFWTDAPEHPETQHADARREVDVAMSKGTVYREPQPEFVVFGARATGAAPWVSVVRAAREREAVEVQVVRR